MHMMTRAFPYRPDGGRHILGERRQKGIKSIMIEGHNMAGRVLAEEIRMGAQCLCMMIGHAGVTCKALNLHAYTMHAWFQDT